MTGIYIHWPFCEAKCPYCDFNSHVRRSINEIDWEIAYLKVLNYWAENSSIRSVKSIFFGGGTPSLMSAELVYKIINEIHKIWNCKADIEITLEANPTSVESQKFNSYAKSGVNRLSMGIQALNDRDLKRLGRLHTVKDAKTAFEVAKNVFNRVSFDLIYGRQYQNLCDWQLELEEALKMSADHLSLYQLTIEKNTRFDELYNKGNLNGLPDDNISVEFYNLTQKTCSDWGLPAYEISNHAKLGSESRHNLNYWNGGCYLGIGPGAHGRLDIGERRFRTEMHSNPEKWLKTVAENNYSDFLKIPLSNNEIAEEYLIMGIRLESGINISYFNKYSEQKLSNKKVKLLKNLGLIDYKNDRLFTTKKGKPVTNYIIKRLLVS